MVLSIPSFAFVSENRTETNSMNQTQNLKFGLTSGFLGNISGENFTDVKAFMLDSISKRITELQSLYTDVSKTSNASDLKEVLVNYRQANERIGLHSMGMRPGRMNSGPCETYRFSMKIS